MSRHLKISRNPDPFFSVEYHGSNYSSIVAPGLVHVYNVRFNPVEKRDYEYRIEFVNDSEIFAVPVIGEKINYAYYIYIIIMHTMQLYGHVTRNNAGQINTILAIGPRPILDIPDRIEIPATAVKIPSSKTILVRNVGNMPAIFNFYSDKYVIFG